MDAKDYQEEIDLQKYWLVLKRRWLPASIAFTSVLALGGILAFLQKPTYQAEGKLLFQSNRTLSLTGLLRGSNDNGGVGDLGRLEALDPNKNNPLDTQAEILRSLPIVQETIKALHLKDKTGKDLESEDFLKNLTVKPVTGTDILRLAYQTDDPKKASAVVNKLIEVFVQNNIRSNRAEPVAAREFIIKQLPKTEATVRQADAALREFKERNGVLVLNEETSSIVRSIAALDEQIAQTQAQLADTSAQSRELQNQVRTTPQQAILYTTLSQSPGVQDALTQLQLAQRELAVQLTRFRGGPPIEKIEQKVTALDALLKERVAEIAGKQQQVSAKDLQLGRTGEDVVPQVVTRLIETEAQRVGLVDRLNTLSTAQATYKQRASSIPELEQTERELNRRLQAAQKTYEALLARLQEIQVAENQNIGNARIIAAAQVPNEPLASKKKLILVGAAVVGLLMGVATAFTLDLIDRSIKTLKEAKELFGYTLLGVIPLLNNRFGRHLLVDGLVPVPQIVLQEMPHSSIVEAFQMLQANLKFLSSDKALKTIVITSSIAGEGKSFVVANLAATAAQMGQRVLLVDADLRHPTQHHIWESMSLRGLSNVVVEQVPLEDVLQEVRPNLFLLPAGVIPPNPIALLDSNRVLSLIEKFSATYDLVLFDAPSLAGKADAAVLGKVVDGVLLIVRPGLTDSSSASAAKEFLSRSEQNVLGMVVNAIDVKNEPDSYFYYVKDHEKRRELTENIAAAELNQLKGK